MIKLKTLPYWFELQLSGEKSFEIRQHDRDYRVGSMLLLEEWSESTGYTGRTLRVDVTAIYCSTYSRLISGIKMGWSILMTRQTV